jgi:hypothetical protein
MYQVLPAPLQPVERIAQHLVPHFQNLSVPQIKAALAYWRQHEDGIDYELDEDDLAAIHLRRKYSRPR